MGTLRRRGGRGGGGCILFEFALKCWVFYGEFLCLFWFNVSGKIRKGIKISLYQIFSYVLFFHTFALSLKSFSYSLKLFLSLTVFSFSLFNLSLTFFFFSLPNSLLRSFLPHFSALSYVHFFQSLPSFPFPSLPSLPEPLHRSARVSAAPYRDRRVYS